MCFSVVNIMPLQKIVNMMLFKFGSEESLLSKELTFSCVGNVVATDIFQYALVVSESSACTLFSK